MRLSSITGCESTTYFCARLFCSPKAWSLLCSSAFTASSTALSKLAFTDAISASSAAISAVYGSWHVSSHSRDRRGETERAVTHLGIDERLRALGVLDLDRQRRLRRRDDEQLLDVELDVLLRGAVDRLGRRHDLALDVDDRLGRNATSHEWRSEYSRVFVERDTSSTTTTTTYAARNLIICGEVVGPFDATICTVAAR